MEILRSIQSEWIKRRHSSGAWLVIIGGLLVPVIVMITVFNEEPVDMMKKLSWRAYWDITITNTWRFMGVFLLPLGVIMTGSLVTQIESRNNTWKQIHVTPQRFSTVFFSKLAVILFMLVQFFVIFNIGLYLLGIFPSILYKAVSYPVQPLPVFLMLKKSVKFFIDCLPILAFQYLLGLRFRNVLAPMGIGIALFVVSMIAMQWKYILLFPYAYCTLNFAPFHPVGPLNHHQMAIVYFVFFSVLGYILYRTQKDKC